MIITSSNPDHQRDRRRIVFLTSTRADFGKLKTVMTKVHESGEFDCHIFVTGMHLDPKYGSTEHEVLKCGFTHLHSFINQRDHDSMDTVLANTIQGFGNYINICRPDLIVVHGDRAEALAGATVGALNNVPVGHFEGGEVSGTIDESIRHAVSKLSHIHFVANEEAQNRLIQMGERADAIYVTGSPDMDLMTSSDLPSIEEVKRHYEIPFDQYAIFTYHPVTTSLHNLVSELKEVFEALDESERNYVMIYPNNDPGSDFIIEEIELRRDNPNVRVFPSVRFEAFLVLLKNCEFIIGNSSTGIREAPFYSRPSINIGSRQNARYMYESILNVDACKEEILQSIKFTEKLKPRPSHHFGSGNSADRFLEIIRQKDFWTHAIQKGFVDLPGGSPGSLTV